MKYTLSLIKYFLFQVHNSFSVFGSTFLLIMYSCHEVFQRIFLDSRQFLPHRRLDHIVSSTKTFPKGGFNCWLWLMALFFCWWIECKCKFKYQKLWVVGMRVKIQLPWQIRQECFALLYDAFFFFQKKIIQSDFSRAGLGLYAYT